MLTVTVKDVLNELGIAYSLHTNSNDDLGYELQPSYIRYDEKSIALGKLFVPVENPRLAFAKALNLFDDSKNEYLEADENGNKIGNIAYQYPKKIGCNCVIGGSGFGFERDIDGTLIRIKHFGEVRFERCVEIGSNVCIDRGVIEYTSIGKGTKIDNLVHIAHNVKIGKHNLIVAGSVIGGSVEIGDNCFIGMGALIKQKVKIGNRVTIGAGAVVLNDVPDGETIVGNPGRKMMDKK